MTIKAIAEKYDVPYYTVYMATYGVEPITGQVREREYPESDVIRNVKCVLQARITKYANKISELQEMLDKVNKRPE